jgi:TPR repeat protein
MKLWFSLLIMFPTILSAETVEEWIARQPVSFQNTLERVHTTGSLMSHLEACPADVFPKSGRYPSGNRDCAKRPGWCLALCRFGNGDACFGIARAIETELDTSGDADLKFPLFMAACAAGNANGCTNAGATAKNGSWLDRSPELARSRDCQYRTYTLACMTGAPWGCYMLGSEWKRMGVNGVTDEAKARQFYERACELAPDGSACRAAKRAMD